VYGSIFEIVNETIFPTKGLWDSLFVSIIAVLLIDRIVRRTELQKSERSIRYVRGRIAHTCSKLAIYSKPPSDWEERLKGDDLTWNHYFSSVSCLRTQALNELDTILDKYGYLIESDLRNDVFDIVNLLNSLTWSALQEPTRSIEDELWRLYNYANMTSAVMSKSTETIKSHRLLESAGISTSFKKGEPPKIKRGVVISQRMREYQIKDHERFLKEAINLRDACHEYILTRKRERTANS